jgi:hypothetical protein
MPSYHLAAVVVSKILIVYVPISMAAATLTAEKRQELSPDQK